jgi:DNA-binding MarR family transcriptional regulator
MIDRQSLSDSSNSGGLLTLPDKGGERMVPTLLSIAKSTRAFLMLMLTEIDLHPGQDQLLHRLELGVPVSVSALADLLAVRPSTVSKMLDRLVDKKLIERTAHRQDGRRTMVVLTPEGQRVKNSVQGIWNRLEADLISALSPREVETLTSALVQVDGLLTVKLRRLR